MYTYILNIF